MNTRIKIASSVLALTIGLLATLTCNKQPEIALVLAQQSRDLSMQHLALESVFSEEGKRIDSSFAGQDVQGVLNKFDLTDFYRLSNKAKQVLTESTSRPWKYQITRRATLKEWNQLEPDTMVVSVVGGPRKKGCYEGITKSGSLVWIK